MRTEHDKDLNSEPDVEVVYHPRDRERYFWTRGNGGWIAGVCQSMAPKFRTTPLIMRLIWIAVAVASFGTGVLLYLACAIAFPNIDELDVTNEAETKKVLGVCLRLSQALRVEIGLVRLIMILLLVGSLGVTALLYLILNFVLPENPQPLR